MSKVQIYLIYAILILLFLVLIGTAISRWRKIRRQDQIQEDLHEALGSVASTQGINMDDVID